MIQKHSSVALAACEEEGKKESETNWEQLKLPSLYRPREMRD